MSDERPDAPAGAEPVPEAETERQSTPFLVLQFFVFPLAIVAVCVAVFVVFGLIAAEGRGAREYLSEIRQGGQNRRWQAAYELAKLIQSGKDPALREDAFRTELVGLLDETSRDDPRVRRYLVLALGRLRERRALPALTRLLDEASPASDGETLIYAAWALGSIGDAAALPSLVRVAGSEDAGVRKAAAHALGGIGGAAAREALVRALDDAVPDVRWNAALALARSRDAAALPVLRSMLDGRSLERVDGLEDTQREEVLLAAARAAAGYADPELRGALETLAASDPSLKVRAAARAALAARAP